MALTGDRIYKSGTCLTKTNKERLRVEFLDLLKIQNTIINESRTLDVGKLNTKTLIWLIINLEDVLKEASQGSKT